VARIGVKQVINMAKAMARYRRSINGGISAAIKQYHGSKVISANGWRSNSGVISMA